MKQLSKNLFLVFILLITSVFYLHSQEEIIIGEDFLFEDLLTEEISGDVKYNDAIKRSGNTIVVITADDIKKKGFTSFSDIVDYVASFSMGSDGLWNFLGVRGLNFPASYGTRLAITIDGNQLRDYVFSSVLNNSVLEISLEFIERIELISGSSSFYYGENGMMGAINIVTKDGKDFDGGVVKATTTNTGETYFEITLGNKWSSGLDLMFSYRGTYNPGDNIYFSEYDDNSIYGDTTSKYYNPRATNGGIAERLNKFFGNVFYLTGKYNNFSLTAMQTISNRKYPSAGFETIFNDQKADIDMDFTNIILSYDWATSLFGMDHNIVPKVHYTRSVSRIYYNYDDEDENGEPIIWSQMEEPMLSGLRFELKDNIALTTSSELTAVISYLNIFDYDSRFSEGENYSYDMEKRDILIPFKLFEGYLEYVNDMTNWFSFFAGVKYIGLIEDELNTSVLLPRAGLIFDVGENSIIKGIFGTGARKPSGNDEYLATTIQINELTRDTIYQSGHLSYETSRTLELIYIYRTKKFLGDFSIFYNEIDNFIYEKEIDPSIVLTPDPSYPYITTNTDEKIVNYGISFNVKYKTDFGLEFMLGNVYSMLNTDFEDEEFRMMAEVGSFRNSLVYGISYEVIDFLYLNLLGKYETSLIAVDRNVDEIFGTKKLPAAHKLNMSLAYRPFYKQDNLKFLNSFYAALTFKNILNRIDYYSVSPSFGTISKIPRDNGYSIGFTLGYTF